MSMPDRRVSYCSEPCSLRQFFLDSRAAMYISTRAGAIIDHNRAFENLLGYCAEQLRISGVASIIHAEQDRVRFMAEIERDGVVHDYPMVLKHQSGALIPCMIDAVVWRSGTQIAGYHGIIRTRASLLESFRRYFNALEEERRQLREARKNLVSDTLLLSRYLSDEMLDVVEKTGRDPLQSGQVKATILFFDIRSSTSIAESTNPEDFALFLSDLLSDIMDLVYGSHGSVNKLLGDGLMASFGCPVDSGNNAWNAIDCAQKIQEYLVTFNDVRPSFLKEEVRAGIGIATGVIFAGIIGSVRRQEYAVLGDAVNIASRLQSLTKSTGESILFDEFTRQDLGKQFSCRPLYNARLRGRSSAIRIYGL